MLETIEAPPIHIGDRKLVPVVRVETDVKRYAYTGHDQTSASGYAIRRMRPIRIIEHTPIGERHIPIRNKTSQIINSLLLVALVVPALLTLIAYLVRKK